MVQLEKTTCTLRVLSETDVGFVYILEGVFIDAEVGALSGLDAAHEIISWEDSVIEIDNTCERSENNIRQPLMNILMEGLRLRDERQAAGGAAKPMGAQPRPAAPAPPKQAPTGPPASTDSEAEHPEPKTLPDTEKPEFAFPKPRKKKSSLTPILMVLVLVLAAGAGAYMFLRVPENEKQHRALHAQLLEASDPKEKVALLEAYLSTRPSGEYGTSAKRQLASFKRALDEQMFTAATRKAAALTSAGDLEAAKAVFENYLKENPATTTRGQTEKEIVAIVERMAAAAYAALARDAQKMGPQRLEHYDAFLSAYPDSTHAAAVWERVAAMEKEYYGYFETQLAVATHEEDWQRGVDLVSRFTRMYPDHPRTRVLSKLIPVFEKNQRQKEDVEKLMAEAQDKGTDYVGAAKVLADHLAAYPDSYLSARLRSQIGRYEALSEKTRIAGLIKSTAEAVNAAGQRFTAKSDGTVLDTRTRLMWTLLDSDAMLQDCLDYEGARAFVSALETGGHDNWRLPTPDELRRFYLEAPAFPATEKTWYWSATFYRQFIGEWVSKVTVVNTDGFAAQEELQKDSRDCGAVRAVRRP